MNVSVSVSNIFPGGAGVSVSISGAAGSTVEVIVDGEGCSARIVITLDASGEGTGFVRDRCLGRAIFVVARDQAGNVTGVPAVSL